MLKIGELSKICNVSQKAIRLYEKKGLLYPVHVDDLTGYRYYDETCIERLKQIIFMKSLGMNLSQIKNLNSYSFNDYSSFLFQKVYELQSNFKKISSLQINKEGEIVMNEFKNDPQVIGKWQFVALAKDKEKFLNGKFEKESFLDPLYFLPNGKGYWLIDSWTKGIIKLYLGEYPVATDCPYEIENNLLYISLRDEYNDKVLNLAVFKRIDNKEYTIEEISNCDNVDIPFKLDVTVEGKWRGVDIVPTPELFKPNKKCFASYIFSLNFMDNGLLEIIQTDGKKFFDKWTKDYWLNIRDLVAQKYEIKNINGKDYLFIENKNGSYIYYKTVSSYFVLEKV